MLTPPGPVAWTLNGELGGCAGVTVTFRGSVLSCSKAQATALEPTSVQALEPLGFLGYVTPSQFGREKHWKIYCQELK